MTAVPTSGGSTTPPPVPAADGVAFAEGFHAPESEAGGPFRWMSTSGRLVFTPLASPAFLELSVYCHFDDLSQRLRLTAEGVSEGAELAHGWNHLSLELPADAADLRLAADRCLAQERHPGDGRELAVRCAPPLLHHDPARHLRAREAHAMAIAAARTMLTSPLAPFVSTARDLRYERGFHHPERGDGLVFRWMAGSARLAFDPRPETRFLELWVHTHFHDLSQRLRVEPERGEPAELGLAHGWNAVSIVVPGGSRAVELAASRLFPAELHGGDARELSVQVRTPLLHGDARRHEHVTRQQRNRVLNLEEMLAGATALRSHPPKLGIDITGTCNVKPACVYCEWDRAKALEGDNVDAPFNLATLREYGPFFGDASELVNCSIGEPFMMKDIDPLLDAFGAHGKLLEMTTNGQILTDTNIHKLLGRHAHLYISLDAATAATYARLRNDRFDLVVGNVRRLVEAKGGRGNLPLVYLVFMPMRANVHEAEGFVELCATLGVDRLVLRPLNPSPGIDLDAQRAGHRFEYQKQLLPFEELVRVSGRVAELCARLGVDLSDQMDFGDDLRERFAHEFEAGRQEVRASPASNVPSAEPHDAIQDLPPTAAPAPAADEKIQDLVPASLGRERLPACTEPWGSLYVLRRGTLPCCYGSSAIAPMGGFRQAWNAPLLQEIRRELAAGRFHRYCFDSPDCPIVRKRAEAHDLPTRQQALLSSRVWLARLRRLAVSWPARVYRAARRARRPAEGRGRRVADGTSAAPRGRS
jgi:MoaA/NifB/PqqE/SkfB family radical SAM enzyme